MSTRSETFARLHDPKTFITPELVWQHLAHILANLPHDDRARVGMAIKSAYLLTFAGRQSSPYYTDSLEPLRQLNGFHICR